MFLHTLLKKVAGRREDAVGLDIGSGSIKMAEVSLRDGKPFLKRMAIAEVPERAVEDGDISDEDAVAETLQRMASKNGFSGNQVVAALGGVLVPLTLERLGLDPALASGTFVTTLTDVMGFFAFLGLATVMLI